MPTATLADRKFHKPPDRKFHKPRYYSELTGKSVDWIRARCSDGSLQAYDFSDADRSDWYIHEDDWAAFLQTKVNAVQPPRPTRRKRPQHVTQFF